MATLMRRDPFRDLMERMFEGSFSRPTLDGYDEEGLLPLDISQTEEQLIVRASLPGFKKENVEVQVENGVLTIKADQKEDKVTENERYYRRERFTGSLSRRVSLPGIVSDTEAQAEFMDGVLEIRVPIAEKAKPKRLEIR